MSETNSNRPLVVGVRVLLLLFALGAVVAAVELTARRTPADASTQFVCPMHPDVQATAPAECPICGMALEPLRRPGEAEVVRDPLAVADLEGVENVRRHNIVDFVRKRSLLPAIQEIRGPAWVEPDGTVMAILYVDQIAALAADEPGDFMPTATPERTIAVRRAPDAPAEHDGSTSRLRFRITRGEAAPGTVGWLSLASRPRQVLTVPASAVLQSPEGPYVLVSIGDFKFAKRPITIGETFLKQGFAVVLAGLELNDRVVARATFFVDADRRLGVETP